MTFNPNNGLFSADYVESYVVGAAVAEVQQGMAIFLPDADQWPKPANGYPIFFFNGSGGFVTTQYGTSLPFTAPAILPWRLLFEHGIAVAWVGLTGTYDALGGPANTASNGRGLFHPPGTTGWTDDLRYSAQKEAILSVQLARHRASTWGIDASKIVVQGGSSGSVAFCAPAFWPDQADGSKSDHRQQSSRVLGFMAEAAQHSFAIYLQANAVPVNFNCLPSASGDITQDLATSFTDAPTTPENYLRWLSTLEIGTDTPAARALNGTGVHLWTHVSGAGEHMASMALTGSFTSTTGKTPVAANTVDQSLGLSFHESGQAHLLIQSLRETEANSWHSTRSRVVMDQTAYDHVIGVDPTLSEYVALIRSFSIIATDLNDAKLAWLTNLMLGLTEGREIVYQADATDQDLTLLVTLKSSDGTTFASGIPMPHFGGGLYKADMPTSPVLAPADRYTFEVYEGATLLYSGLLIWTGTEAVSAPIVEVMSVSPEYPVRLFTRKRGVSSEGVSNRRTTFKSTGTQSSLEAVRRWGLSWAMATQAEADRMFDIFENTRGGVLPMAFVPPGDTLTTVRFADNNLSISQVGPNQYSMQFELEEMTNA